MRFIEKVIGIITILLLLGLHFPEIGFSWQRAVYAKADTSKPITKNAPELLAPPEVEIPVTTTQPAKPLKINKWVWVGLGVLAAGVLAGAGGGGGDGGGDNGDKTGTIVINGPAP